MLTMSHTAHAIVLGCNIAQFVFFSTVSFIQAVFRRLCTQLLHVQYIFYTSRSCLYLSLCQQIALIHRLSPPSFPTFSRSPSLSLPLALSLSISISLTNTHTHCSGGRTRTSVKPLVNHHCRNRLQLRRAHIEHRPYTKID